MSNSLCFFDGMTAVSREMFMVRLGVGGEVGGVLRTKIEDINGLFSVFVIVEIYFGFGYSYLFSMNNAGKG